MTHPTKEEWMAYLYQETPTPATNEMQLHLQQCAECRSQFDDWNRSRHQLDQWPLRQRALPGRSSWKPIGRWAAAAAIVALAVVGGARLSAVHSEVRTLRAEVTTHLRRDIESSVRLHLAQDVQRRTDAALARLTAEADLTANAEIQSFVADFAERYEAKRQREQALWFSALRQLETRQAADYMALRKELETVAVFTEAGLQRAQNQIASIAYSPEQTASE